MEIEILGKKYNAITILLIATESNTKSLPSSRIRRKIVPRNKQSIRYSSIIPKINSKQNERSNISIQSKIGIDQRIRVDK